MIFLSNAPLPKPPKDSDEHKSASIQFNIDPDSAHSDYTGVSTKRGRGRPHKNTAPAPSNKAQPKRGRGHPRKSQPPDSTQCNTGTPCPSKSQADSSQPPKRGRGRPRKSEPPADSQISTSDTAPAVVCLPKPQACHSSQPQSVDRFPKHGTSRGIKRANDDDDEQSPSKMQKLGVPSITPSNALSIHRNVTNACVQLQQTVRQLLGNTSPGRVCIVIHAIIELCKILMPLMVCMRLFTATSLYQ